MLEKIRKALETFQPFIDGKTTIMEMKNNGSNNWKQMEWGGFWFEEEFRKKLNLSIGKRYGKTVFDCLMDNINIDCKLHSIVDKDGKTNLLILGNDLEAVENVIKEDGYFYIIVAEVRPDYDIDYQFVMWHNELKGKVKHKHQYKFSRIRKKSFTINSFKVFKIDENVLQFNKGFQKGFKNSNGNKRKNKFSFNINDLEPVLIVDVKEINEKNT